MAKNHEQKLRVTKETLEDLGQQMKDFLKNVEAYVEDYKLSIISEKGGVSVEFFLKAKFK